ncbi:adenosylmethionine decarboxylase [bacterium]|jgi:S-adenosylmethionine decarboxylase|nr:adenosylmethionine decarboxylase [bacterium]
MNKKARRYYSKCEQFNYAGTHLLLELWGAENVTSLEKVKKALIESVNACGATLLEIKLHRFSPNQGISGIAIIKESHLSIHTWPEFGYVAIDIFVCGEVNPYKAIPVLKKIFKPKKMQLLELKRGILE